MNWFKIYFCFRFLSCLLQYVLAPSHSPATIWFPLFDSSSISIQTEPTVTPTKLVIRFTGRNKASWKIRRPKSSRASTSIRRQMALSWSWCIQRTRMVFSRRESIYPPHPLFRRQFRGYLIMKGPTRTDKMVYKLL